MKSTSREVSELLRSRPREWARVASYASFNTVHGRAKSMRQGLVSAFSPAKAFETAVRRVNEDEYLLFARYVGQEETEVSEELNVPAGFRFVGELPEPGSRVSEREYLSIAERLRSRPGETHILQGGLSVRQAQRLASRVRSGELAAFRPAGEFEATPIKESGGLWCVRIRPTRLIVPETNGGHTPEYASGWLAGVAWYQEHTNEDRTLLQREVDRHVRQLDGSGEISDE